MRETLGLLQFELSLLGVKWLAALTLMGMGLTGNAAIIRVGAGAPANNCEFASLQAALVEAQNNGDVNNSILLANNMSHTNVHVTITGNKYLAIEGGYDDCLDNVADSTVRTTLSGVGGTGSVITVNLSSGGDPLSRRVELLDLIISGGNEDPVASPSYGGGIELISGVLGLFNTNVQSNFSTYGGGIFVRGGGAVPSKLILTLSSLIAVNTARPASGNGGGIGCENGALIELADASVVGNSAQGAGGGIFLNNCTLNLTAKSSLANVNGAVIASNSAQTGGGIYATNGAKINTILPTFPGFIPLPTLISGNTASVAGGAMALFGSNTDPRVEVNLTHARISNNEATVGGSAVTISQRANFILSGGAPWLTCAGLGSGPCTQISNNTVTGTGSACTGAIEGLNGSGSNDNLAFVGLYRVYVASNTQPNCFNQDGTFFEGLANLGMANTIITNQGGHSIFNLENFDATSPINHNIWFDTISGNSATTIFRNRSVTTDQSISLYGSIVHNSGTVRDVNARAIAFNAPSTCQPIVNENISTSGVGQVADPELDSAFTPRFVTSESVDVCPEDTVWSPDFYGNARPMDMVVNDIHGPQDLGAVEKQVVSDTLFVNGFEGL